MKLIYKDDINGQEGLFSEDGVHQIMMEWEKEYMHACIDKLNPTGNVLEIGFGLGYSADKIQTFNIKSHTIIECNPVVLERLEEYKKNHPNVIIIKGRWQDVLETCGKFDSIFFDDYVLDGTLDLNRLSKFCIEVLKNHANINSKISYYSTTDKNPFKNSDNIIKYECDNYDVKIPENCKYAKGDKMYIPLITKINNDINELNYTSSIPKFELSSLKCVDNINNKVENCYSNYIVINNFYNNIDLTRNFVLSIDFNKEGISNITSFSEQIKNHIEKYLPFNSKIIDFDNKYNGKYKLENREIDEYVINKNDEYSWSGILYMTPNSDINNGIDIYKKDKLTDIIGNIYNRLVLIPKHVVYVDKRFYNSDKNKNSLTQIFCFNTKSQIS